MHRTTAPAVSYPWYKLKNDLVHFTLARGQFPFDISDNFSFRRMHTCDTGKLLNTFGAEERMHL